MEKTSETFESSLTTFNENLITLANNKKEVSNKPLSRIARVFNRSVAERNYKSDEVGNRGKFVKNSSCIDIYRSEGTLIKLTRDGRELGIRSMLVARSPKAVKEIDKHFETFRKRDKSKERDLFIPTRIGAIVTVLYGALHPFPDANGRTAIALSGYAIGANHALKGKNVGLDLEKLEANSSHSTYMTLCGIAFSPSPYSIGELFGRCQKGKQVVDIVEELGSGQKRDEYLKGFLKNVERCINSVNWETGEIELSETVFPSKYWFELGLKELQEILLDSLSVK